MKSRSSSLLADGQGRSGNRVHLRAASVVENPILSFSHEPIPLRSKGELLLILTIATMVLLLRKPDSVVNPQLWAEDGTIFFLQQYEYGASAITQPYAGYLHLVPRLIAFVADSFFPYAFIPHIYNYLSLLITLLVIASIYSPRFIVGNKYLLSLAMVVVPHYTNEVFLNITNLQWILAILLMTTLLREPPDPKYGNVSLQIISDFTALLCCGLTGPFLIFLIPFFLWRWFKDRNSYNFIVVLVVIAVASIQMFFIINNAPLILGGEKANYDLGSYAKVVGRKLFGNLFLGTIVPYHINSFILCSLLLLFISLILYLSLDGNKRKSHLVFVFLSFSFAVLLATFNKFKSDLLILAPPANGPRYFYLPYLFIIWSLAICLEQKEGWKSTVVKVLLGIVLTSSLISGFHSEALIDYKWRFYSSLIGKAQHVTIPINPPGWYLHLAKKE